MNSYTVSLPILNTAEIAWFSSFEIRDLNQEQPLSFDSSGAFYCFSNGIMSPTILTCACVLLQIT